MSPGPSLLPALLLALACLTPSAGRAGDVFPGQAIRGTKLTVKDPKPADPSRRKLRFSARDPDPSHTLSDDPTAPPFSNGALLRVTLEGSHPSSQSFGLGQGTNARGKPFWKALGSRGFRYQDPRGERGPVKSLKVKRSKKGTFSLSAKLSGKRAPLDLVPPDSGTGAFVTLAFGGGEPYCVRFGDGKLRDRGPRSFQVKKPLTEGCPEGDSGEFLALSYNVAGLPVGFSSSEPDINTPFIAPLLNGYDLVLVQESWKTPELNPFEPLRVFHEILEEGSRHPFHSVSAPLPFGTDPERESALVSDGLNRFSQFPFEEVNRQRWNGCHISAADCLALKGFSMARTTIAPGVQIDVYNLHMEAGGDPEDEALRDAGVTQLVDFMEANSAGRAILIGGDFNLHTDEEPDATQYQRLLDEAGLTDVCAALACPQPARIDKFAFRSSADVAVAPLSWNFETDVFVRDDGEPLSDHDPLAVRFIWARGDMLPE